MGLASGLTVFLVIWWLVVFMVLPWGNKPIDDDDVAKGHASSAPAKPRLIRKMAITTAITTVLWFGVYFIIESGLISFRPGA